MSRSWKEVWDARRLDSHKGSELEQLMAAGGLETGPGGVTEDAWRDFVERAAETLDIGPGTRVFEVGCGAGAFLYPLYENGYVVGGLDQSAALVSYAAQAMPDGRWTIGDASALDPGEPWDVVVACGMFGYFPDLDYARGVLARMAAKATHAIAILDVPDLERRAEMPAARPPSPGETDDEARRAGLDHLFYGRGWMLRALAEIGMRAVRIEDQRIDGCRHAPFRINVFARA